MSEVETYLTKRNPSIEDWLEYNQGLFEALRSGKPPQENVQFAPLTDFDDYAFEAGVELDEYFEQLKTRVGSLGRFALYRIHVDMDDATHIVIHRDS